MPAVNSYLPLHVPPRVVCYIFSLEKLGNENGFDCFIYLRGHTMSNSRGDIDLVGHKIVSFQELDAGTIPLIKNIIVIATKPEERWIEDVTRQIGEWRAKLRSAYIRWALAINGLEVAAKKYAEPNWAAQHDFIVTSLRPDENGIRPDGGIKPKVTIIARWDGPTASQAHLNTMPMLATFGVIDLYAHLEEVIFALYRTYLNYHHRQLLRGNEFKNLRRLKREADEDATAQSAWEAAWQERLNSWQRKKLYDGLPKVFKSFCDIATIKASSIYKHGTVESWCECIEIIGLVRNALVHGATTVSDELAAACAKPYSLAFDFEKDKPLIVHLYHLQGIDLFCEQLLSALNCSLFELTNRAMPFEETKE